MKCRNLGYTHTISRRALQGIGGALAYVTLWARVKPLSMALTQARRLSMA